MDILSDIIQSSKLDEQDIERERDVILREMEVNIFVVCLRIKCGKSHQCRWNLIILTV